METDLNAILSGTATTQPDPTPEPTPAAPTEPEQPTRRDEELDDGWEDGRGSDQQGDKQPADDADPSAPPADEEDSAKSVPVKALKEERRKRQELERRLAELEAKAPQQPEGPVDPVRQRLDLSVEYAREQFSDYEEKETAFVDAIKTHPRGKEIYQAMLGDKHPARFAYELGAKILALREIGDPRTYKQRVMAEAKAAAPPPKPQAERTSDVLRTSLPQTLAASRDSGGRFSPRDSAAPTPLGEIIAR